MNGDLFLYSFLTACFSAFLDYCMLEGEIFGKYRELVEKMGYWGKPLGGCMICTNVWLCVLSFGFTGLSILWLIPYISLGYVFLQVISKFEQ